MTIQYSNKYKEDLARLEEEDNIEIMERIRFLENDMIINIEKEGVNKLFYNGYLEYDDFYDDNLGNYFIINKITKDFYYFDLI